MEGAGGLQLTKVVREVLCCGNLHDVCHGLVADGSSPSAVAFVEMAKGEWEEDPNFSEPPDLDQITQTEKLRAGIEFFARNGYPNNSYCTVNELRGGIWEFKLGRVRVSFYDTDGAGAYAAKRRVNDRRESSYPDHDFWWLPDFDDDLRLGHCFGKTSQQTEEEDIQETLRVREEDLTHDYIG